MRVLSSESSLWMAESVAALPAGADAAHTEAYRKLASDAVTAQAGNAATLSAIQSELSELKTRMTNVEKILKAVE